MTMTLLPNNYRALWLKEQKMLSYVAQLFGQVTFCRMDVFFSLELLAQTPPPDASKQRSITFLRYTPESPAIRPFGSQTRGANRANFAVELPQLCNKPTELANCR